MDAKGYRKLQRVEAHLQGVLDDLETFDWTAANRSNDVLDVVVAVQELTQDAVRRLHGLLGNDYHKPGR